MPTWMNNARLILGSLQMKDVSSAWSAFGRLTHTAQDFYAHSNYVDLWLACQPDGALPTPSEIDPVDPDLIDTRALRSGRIYMPLELLGMLPGLRSFALRFLPRDSHAWMNLDSPERGPNFNYAFQAGLKRTRLEFQKTRAALSQDLLSLFLDM